MNKNTASSAAIIEKINQCLQFPTVDSMRQADQLRTELLQAEEDEAEVLKLKAGIKWREQGERSTKFFLSRLKSREIARDMQGLVDANGTPLSGLQVILEHVKSFYAKLYGKVISHDNDRDDDFFAHCPTLDAVQQQQLARPLTIAELKETLKTCQDSGPGLDGIPYSFYSSFSDILLPTLLNSWNFALNSGQLAQSHLQSCITLLPKKNKDLKHIQNWRPISLSPCDLKIITKTYARRLSLILPHILSEAQAAYVPGRDISFNNRLLRTALKFAQDHNKDYSIISLDARKAFDSVSHEYLGRVMEAYQFPAEFVSIFKILYSINCASVQVNGHLSSPFQLERGVKQGDALSCGLFVLAIDPLLRNIKANDNIKGLTIPTDENESIEIKVLAYADDVAVVCKNRNLQPIFTEYERLSRVSGLELNAEKTEIINLVDSNRIVSAIRYREQNFLIGRIESIKICGLYLSREPQVDYQRNILEAISKMEQIISSWKNRGLTLNGRMIAVKTFVLSQIVFQAQALTIAVKESKRIERLIYSFVNGAKSLYGPERIARIKLKASKERGSINGVDVESFIKTIQLRQYNKALNKHRTLGSLQASYSGCKDDLSLSVSSSLRAHYRSLLKVGLLDLQQITQVSSVPLHLFLTPGTRAYTYASNLAISSLYELQRCITNGQNSRIQANLVLKQLPGSIRLLVRNNTCVDAHSSILVVMENDTFTAVEQIKSSLLRRRFMELRKGPYVVQAKEVYKQPQWQEPEAWQRQIWKIKNPQLRGYRLKLLYKDIFCNERRFRFNLTNSPNCLHCGQIETVAHQFLECPNAQRLWGMYQRVTGRVVSNMLEIITCLESPETEIVKSIIIKRLIQIDRSTSINFAAIKLEIKHFFRIEACSNKSSSRFWMQCLENIDRV